MTIKEQQVVIAGIPLHQLVLSPSGASRGSLLFFHGQGDFIDRYPPLLEGFVDAGFQCLLTDFPGHGRSPGTRGEVPGIRFVDQLVSDCLTQLRGPTVLSGHSVGGLMALRYLLRDPDRYHAAWISSPILDPMRQASPWMKVALPFASRFLPWVTVGTGVRSEDCGDNQGGRKESPEGVLYHSRISIGWGRDLRDIAEEVRAQFQGIPSRKKILFTQGADDRICPPEILQEQLNKLPQNEIHFDLIPRALHEPFNGSTSDEFLSRLNSWIDQELRSD